MTGFFGDLMWQYCVVNSLKGLAILSARIVYLAVIIYK